MAWNSIVSVYQGKIFLKIFITCFKHYMLHGVVWPQCRLVSWVWCPKMTCWLLVNGSLCYNGQRLLLLTLWTLAPWISNMSFPGLLRGNVKITIYTYKVLSCTIWFIYFIHQPISIQEITIINYSIIRH